MVDTGHLDKHMLFYPRKTDCEQSIQNGAGPGDTGESNCYNIEPAPRRPTFTTNHGR